MTFQPQLVSGAHVIAVWAAMQKLYGTTVIDKSDSRLMKVVGSTLDLLGVQDKETFLKKYTTTINRAIYMPYPIGAPGVDFIGQLALCAHEHQHVVQADREGWPAFAARYVVDHAARAVYEAEAYACNLEIAHALRGTPIAELAGATAHYARALKEGYGCTDDDVAVVEAALDLSLKQLESGVVVNEASRRVIQLAEVIVGE